MLSAPPRPSRRLVGWAVASLYVLLLAGFAVGIWASYRATFPGAGLYRVTGVVLERASDTLIVVSHERVPGLMEEMSAMVFEAESRVVLDQAALVPGDRARFTVRQERDRLVVVEVQKIR